ncbi:unnamed protein product [Caenorhabditis auriculariae]|uniref:Uncharacterized protein n=1 Tax=Caenorhabditis auriculariae TaxID=2777116 RepID=A0A8S1HLL1_9PELO|nr:unnamed protein product [Caenorhabditis auriculariae]
MAKETVEIGGTEKNLLESKGQRIRRALSRGSDGGNGERRPPPPEIDDDGGRRLEFWGRLDEERLGKNGMDRWTQVDSGKVLLFVQFSSSDIGNAKRTCSGRFWAILGIT